MKHKKKKIQRQFKAQKQDKSFVNQKQQKCGAMRKAELLGLLAAGMGAGGCQDFGLYRLKRTKNAPCQMWQSEPG